MKLKTVHILLVAVAVLIIQTNFIHPSQAQEGQQQEWEYENVFVETKTASIWVYSDNVTYMDSLLKAPWQCRENYCGTTNFTGWEVVLDAWGSDGWELVNFQIDGANWITLIVFDKRIVIHLIDEKRASRVKDKN